jgi:pimeloyl-ACP methyl ester carboxylesterase
MARARIVLLPGMIADETLYARVRAVRPLTLVPWPSPQRGWSMADCARAIIARDAITADDVVGGISLGGMMALEIARVVRVRRVALISSCRRLEHISRALISLAAAQPWLPARALRDAPLPQLARADRARLQAIAARMDPQLLRWSCQALRAWRGDAGVACPISQLHGANDLLIAARRVRPDVLVRGAGHFLCLTHPHRVAAFLDGLPD